jgi:hypothetical protein
MTQVAPIDTNEDVINRITNEMRYLIENNDKDILIHTELLEAWKAQLLQWRK